MNTTVSLKPKDHKKCTTYTNDKRVKVDIESDGSQERINAEVAVLVTTSHKMEP